jgi:hypothetical protein
MCLILRRDEISSIAEEDIIVYKLMCEANSVTVKSPYLHYEYIFNKLYKTIIKETDDFCYFDTIDEYYYQNLNEDVELKSLSEGFHSALTINRLLNINGTTDYPIYKCIIPKGSVYFKDETGLIISNQIIITKEIVYE